MRAHGTIVIVVVLVVVAIVVVVIVVAVNVAAVAIIVTHGPYTQFCCTKILDFRGADSSVILIIRVEFSCP